MSKTQPIKKESNQLDREYEIQCDECTFMPDLKSRNNKSNFSKPPKINGTEKNIQRIAQAYYQKQINNNLRNTGNTINSLNSNEIEFQIQKKLDCEKKKKKLFMEEKKLKRNVTDYKTSSKK